MVLSSEDQKIQTRKAALEIKYQLFTSLVPEKKRVGPFNTDQILYCDLVNIICNQERNELGEDMTVELYTCEGYPLATRPISYISKLSDWCLEEYPDTPLLYAVPRLKYYTDKCTQYMTAAPLCDGTDAIFLRNTECGFKTHFRTNCTQGTYFQLIKRIQDMTRIPGHLIQLYKADNFIHSSTDVTLDKLDIVNQSALEMKPIIDFWILGKDRNFMLQECKPTWHQEQSTYGSTFFFSCLYSLADWMAEPLQQTSGVLLRTLGHIRSIIGCPPLIHALNLLFSKETLTLPHRVAIQECLVLLFKVIKPKTFHLPNFEIINAEKVTEYSNYFWVYLIDNSTPGHTQSEQYSTFKLTCSESHHRMDDPVIVKDVNGVEHIAEQNTVDAEIIVKYLYNYKRMLKCFIGDEAVVWNGIYVPTCGIDLTGEWKGLIKRCKNYPALCVQAPLNVKSTECHKPCMIPTENGNIGVYIDSSKDTNKPHIYYEVTTGQSILFDAHELDRAVKKNKSLIETLAKDWQTLQPHFEGLEVITRDPEEIIMVILDTSVSMNSAYLNDKTKYESVFEAFLAFCDRTTAYDLKHLIGLILFAKNCKLQYPLSENFREFNYQFENPLQGKSIKSIYDAIKFAIENLNKFTTLFPKYKAVPRRILCLTDGGDNNSNITPTKVTQLLIENKIIMDCVLLCNSVVETHAIAKASGGYSFIPKDSLEMLSIFEQETMLSMKIRKQCTASFIPGGKIDLTSKALLPFGEEPTHLLPDRIHIKVQTALKCLARALIQKQLSTHTNNADLTKRILQELSFYQAHPHPAIEVFPGEEHFDFWRIIMEGPEDTPYEGGIFELFIEFTNEYPSKPPNIRFITPIYHCSINSSGRIGLTILDRFYAPGVRVGDIFNHVYGHLIDAEPDDPLDSVKATLLRFDRNEYLKKARDYTEQHAKIYSKKDVRISLLGSDQNVQVNYPAELVCPLTLELFENPVSTVAGETYEREAILKHLRSGKNYDPFTSRELHEDELRPNKAVRKAVTEFKQEIERAGQL